MQVWYANCVMFWNVIYKYALHYIIIPPSPFPFHFSMICLWMIAFKIRFYTFLPLHCVIDGLFVFTICLFIFIIASYYWRTVCFILFFLFLSLHCIVAACLFIFIFSMNCSCNVLFIFFVYSYQVLRVLKLFKLESSGSPSLCLSVCVREQLL